MRGCAGAWSAPSNPGNHRITHPFRGASVLVSEVLLTGCYGPGKVRTSASRAPAPFAGSQEISISTPPCGSWMSRSKCPVAPTNGSGMPPGPLARPGAATSTSYATPGPSFFRRYRVAPRCWMLHEARGAARARACCSAAISASVSWAIAARSADRSALCARHSESPARSNAATAMTLAQPAALTIPDGSRGGLVGHVLGRGCLP